MWARQYRVSPESGYGNLTMLPLWRTAHFTFNRAVGVFLSCDLPLPFPNFPSASHLVAHRVNAVADLAVGTGAGSFIDLLPGGRSS